MSETDQRIGYLFMFAGSILIFAPGLLGLATLVVDTGPPVIGAMFPANTGLYPTLTQIWVYVDDAGSGVARVTAYLSWTGTVVQLSQPNIISEPSVWSKNLYDTERPPQTGSAYVTFTAYDNTGQSSQKTTAFTMGISILIGTWKVNGETLVSETQVIKSTSNRVTFTFLRDADKSSVVDTQVTVKVSWTGALTNVATSASTGSVNVPLVDATNHKWETTQGFGEGKYTIVLKADAGAGGIVSFNITGQIGAAQVIPLNLMAGAVTMLVGAFLVLRRKT